MVLASQLDRSKPREFDVEFESGRNMQRSPRIDLNERRRSRAGDVSRVGQPAEAAADALIVPVGFRRRRARTVTEPLAK